MSFDLTLSQIFSPRRVNWRFLRERKSNLLNEICKNIEDDLKTESLFFYYSNEEEQAFLTDFSTHYSLKYKNRCECCGEKLDIFNSNNLIKTLCNKCNLNYFSFHKNKEIDLLKKFSQSDKYKIETIKLFDGL